MRCEINVLQRNFFILFLIRHTLVLLDKVVSKLLCNHRKPNVVIEDTCDKVSRLLVGRVYDKEAREQFRQNL